MSPDCGAIRIREFPRPFHHWNIHLATSTIEEWLVRRESLVKLKLPLILKVGAAHHHHARMFMMELI